MNDGLSSSPPPGRFATTHWSLVLAAGAASPAGNAALAELCETYWYPLYAFIRRRTGDTHAAQDLTQAFFARMLETEMLAAADPERGRFRSYLRTACQNFLQNEAERDRALKRGGGRSPLRIDISTAESRYSLEPADEETPEKLFDRQWAKALLARVLDSLAAESAAAGAAQQFARLKLYLAGERDSAGYAAVAADFGLTEGAVKAAVHRLRRRYRELLRAEIAKTVDGPQQIDDEIRSLFAAFD